MDSDENPSINLKGSVADSVTGKPRHATGFLNSKTTTRYKIFFQKNGSFELSLVDGVECDCFAFTGYDNKTVTVSADNPRSGNNFPEAVGKTIEKYRIAVKPLLKGT
jgi:hypothetical protein